MNNEKLDTTLNLSLETEESVRQKSEVLSTGFDEQANTWEVIVKYHGDIRNLEEIVQAVDILVNGYAIMTVTRGQLELLVQSEQIEFVELPKSMQYNTYRAKQASCILPVTRGDSSLSGRGVLIACIDSGIDYLLRDFQNENGSRILYLWDQTIRDVRRIPAGFSKGVEYTKEDIDRAIAVANGEEDNVAGESDGQTGERVGNQQRSRSSFAGYNRAWDIVPSRDITGHGTAVAGIAAGNSVSPLYQGIAPGSDLLIVKLAGNTQTNGITTDLMRGITYVVQKAQQLGRPVAINLSIGDTYGAHEPCN